MSVLYPSKVFFKRLAILFLGLIVLNRAFWIVWKIDSKRLHERVSAARNLLEHQIEQELPKGSDLNLVRKFAQSHAMDGGSDTKLGTVSSEFGGASKLYFARSKAVKGMLSRCYFMVTFWIGEDEKLLGHENKTLCDAFF